MIESFMGKKETSTDELDAVGKALIPSYIGAFPRDAFPELKNNQCMIINEGDIKSGGWHWVAYYRKNNTNYFYDSFGRNKNMIKELRNKKVKSSDKDKEQNEDSEFNCGQRCLSWLICCEKFGPENALLI